MICRASLLKRTKEKVSNSWTLNTSDDGVLGSGCFGKVVQGTHKTVGLTRAVKIIAKQGSQAPDAIEREVMLMGGIDHPLIARLYAVNEDKQTLHLIMERCSGGSLYNFVQQRQQLLEEQARVVMYQVLQAIHALQALGIAHNDLTAHNILVTNGANLDLENPNALPPTVKLIDFGSSSKFEPKEVHRKNDLWRCGALLHFLISGDLSDEEKHQQKLNEQRAAKQDAAGGAGGARVRQNSRVPQGRRLSNTPQTAAAQPVGRRAGSVAPRPKLEEKERVQVGDVMFDREGWDNVTAQAKAMAGTLLRRFADSRASAQQALAHKWFASIDRNLSREAVELLKLLPAKLEEFKEFSLVKQVALEVLADQLEDCDLRVPVEAFRWIDFNGDGLLTPAEIAHGLQVQGLTTGVTLPAVRRMLADFDADGVGVLSRTTFLACTMGKDIYTQDKHVRIIYEALADKSGKQIDLQSIRTAVLPDLQEKWPKALASSWLDLEQASKGFFADIVKPFQATSEDQMNVAPGDVVEVSEPHESGWTYGWKVKENGQRLLVDAVRKEGWFPTWAAKLTTPGVEGLTLEGLKKFLAGDGRLQKGLPASADKVAEAAEEKRTKYIKEWRQETLTPMKLDAFHGRDQWPCSAEELQKGEVSDSDEESGSGDEEEEDGDVDDVRCVRCKGAMAPSATGAKMCYGCRAVMASVSKTAGPPVGKTSRANSVTSSFSTSTCTGAPSVLRRSPATESL
eukprot:TRINITY_DN122155_c0_g1_i1.p1 TRINITY_DN122155_c0_g1~~TRINITY_DN122155_c0_g1_i1.p1  ORF type:complete len:738 (-),score=174.18 TRINITY_DN122155_c0_g1_i1:161-2374(-)